MSRGCRSSEALVVVDLQALEPDAGPTAACVLLGRTERDGIDLLEAAGHPTTPTARDGRAFVCRIDGRPGSRERLDTAARTGYLEQCVDTPPTTAHWTFWTARPGECDWSYAATGAAGAVAEPGTAHGWSFALDAPTGRAPEPRIGPCDDGIVLRAADTGRASSGSSDPSSSGIDPLLALLLFAVIVAGVLVRARRRRARDAQQPGAFDDD